MRTISIRYTSIAFIAATFGFIACTSQTDDAAVDTETTESDAAIDGDAMVLEASAEDSSFTDAGDAASEGEGGTESDASDASAPLHVVAVYRGSYSESVYVRYSDGRIKAFGDNSDGALGLGNMDIARGYTANQMGANLPFVDLGAGKKVASLSTAATTACAVLTDGSVKCWGGNAYGQLGSGNTTSRGENAGDMGDNLPTVSLGTGRTATAISSGTGFNCAILDNGSVKCWGLNDSGQLGLGNTDNRGDDPNEMGDNLPAIDLGTGRTAKSISSGYGTTCAILDNNSLKCWGNNYWGPLGLEDGDNRGEASGQMGDSLPAVNVGTGRTVVEVSVGDGRTCARLDNAAIKCWGYGEKGALGRGTKDSVGYSAGTMGDNLPVVSLGTGRSASALGHGDGSMCAILDNGATKCWGLGEQGQLGDGQDANNKGDDPNEMGDNLAAIDLGTGRKAIQLAGGFNSWCALLDNYAVKCWGNAGHGLGYASTNTIGDGPNEMGDNLPEIDLTP